MAAANRTQTSMDTILTYNRDASQWSIVWSTAHIPGMDNASGGNAQSGLKGRRKIRFGSLALGAFLTMHSRVAASALTGGFFVFMLFLIMATAILANPLRHFEVYLGQWSISGPGRAYRVLPVFEGIGLAICINAIVRALLCCTLAAIATMYVIGSISDSRLPFTYCRDFDLNQYEPISKDFTFREPTFSWNYTELLKENVVEEHVTIGTRDFTWRNISNNKLFEFRPKQDVHKLLVCNESYSRGYPVLYHTPEYNFFYVEIVFYREESIFGRFNMPISFALIFIWSIFWIILVIERAIHQRLIWNNIYSWLVVVPWIWTLLLLITALAKLNSTPVLSELSKIGAKQILDSLTDALEVAIYIHAASLGTEIIHGKGLNHYAMGHIDPHLNGENVWHSGLLVLLTGLHSGGATICTLVDSVPATYKTNLIQESTVWIFPLYSKCTLVHNYSHVLSTIIFSGLTFAYVTVAFILVKTVLHTIFEYKVKLVFVEQTVVAVTILSCIALNLTFATISGVALLESIDAILTGIAMPFICLLEVAPLLYIYHGQDFLSDMHLATEDNACSSRIGTQWLFIPLILLVIIVMKTSTLLSAEMPATYMCVATAPLAAALLAPALRAARNAYKFMRTVRRAK